MEFISDVYTVAIGRIRYLEPILVNHLIVNVSDSVFFGL